MIFVQHRGFFYCWLVLGITCARRVCVCFVEVVRVRVSVFAFETGGLWQCAPVVFF